MAINGREENWAEGPGAVMLLSRLSLTYSILQLCTFTFNLHINYQSREQHKRNHLRDCTSWWSN